MKNNEMNCASAGEIMPGSAESEGARKIKQSIDYMVQHLDQPLQVATLAGTVHVSPSHFFALFKRCVGYSPINYFIRLRMRQASQFLTDTSMSVKEVASELGYEDPFYFSRVFKTIHGLSPNHYRRQREETSSPLEQTHNMQVSEVKTDEMRSILHSKREDFAARVSRLMAASSLNTVFSRQPLTNLTPGQNFHGKSQTL